MEKEFVVYQHRRKDTGKIFYIGIGNKKRPYDKFNRNYHWNNIVKKYGYDIEIIYELDNWLQACIIEIMLIEKYGRRDLGIGTLVNLTNGGDGCIGRLCSEETKEKSRIIHTKLTGKKVYLYELYTDKVLEFDAKRDACRFLIDNGFATCRKKLYDGLVLAGEYLIKENIITQEEKVELVYNTPQIDLKVLKMSMDFTEVIEEYSSARDAARQNNCVNILAVLNKNIIKRKSSIGFRWVYKVDYIYKGLDYLKELYTYKRTFNKTSLIRKKVPQ